MKNKEARRYKKYRNSFGKRMSGKHAQYVSRFIHHHGRRTDWGLQFLYAGLPRCSSDGKYRIEECLNYENYLGVWRSEGVFALSREGYHHGEPIEPHIRVRLSRRANTDQAYA